MIQIRQNKTSRMKYKVSKALLVSTVLTLNVCCEALAENFIINGNPIQFQDVLGEDEYLTAADVIDILTQYNYTGAPGLNDLLAKPSVNIDEGSLVPDQPDEYEGLPVSEGGKVPSSGTKKKYTEVTYDKNGIPSDLVDTGTPISVSGGLQGIQFPFDMNRVKDQNQSVTLTSFFSYRKNSDLEFHNGLDLSGFTGENGVAKQLNLYAPADCIIKEISTNKQPYTGFGNVVVMEFSLNNSSTTYRFIYAHMNYINSQLRVGMNIKQGEYIGRTGNTGGNYGTHLHLSILASKTGNFDDVNGVPKMTAGCGSTNYLINPLIVYGLPATANGNDTLINKWVIANGFDMVDSYAWESKSEPKKRNKTFLGSDNVTKNCFSQIILPSKLL